MKSILYLGVFLIPLIYNPWGVVNPYEAGKQSFLIAFLGIALLVGAYILLARPRIEWQINKPLFIVIGLWFASYLVSTIFSRAPIESLWGTYERLQGFISHLYYGLHFVLCVQLFKNKKMRERFLHFTFFVGLVVSVHAIVQYFSFTPEISALTKSLFGRRVFATIGNPTMLGQFLLFPIFVGVVKALYAAREKNKLAFMYGIGVLPMLLALLLSQNRASMLGLFASLTLLALYLFYTHVKNKRRVLVGFFCLTIAVFVVGYAFGIFSSRLRSLESRRILWNSAVQLAPENFLIGSGPETLYQTIQTKLSPELYAYERLSDIPDRTHNELLDVLLTRGIFGALLYLVPLYFLVYLFMHKKLQTESAQAAFFALSAYMISVQFSFSLSTHLIFLLAMYVLLIWETGVPRLRPVALSFTFRSFVAPLCVGIALFSFVFAYRLSAVDVRFGNFLSAFFRNDAQALDVFDKATDSLPQYAYFYNSFYIFYNEKTGSDPKVTVALQKYADRLKEITNANFKYYFARAQFEQARGRSDLAEKNFSEVVARAPNWPEAWLWRGEDAVKRKDFRLATFALEKYLGFAPDYVRLSSARPLTATERESYRIFSLSNPRYFYAQKLLERMNQ